MKLVQNNMKKSIKSHININQLKISFDFEPNKCMLLHKHHDRGQRLRFLVRDGIDCD